MSDRTIKNVTVLLDRLGSGDAGAFALLVEAVYSDVRSMAAIRLKRFAEGEGGLTIQATLIAHDVLLAFQKQRNLPQSSEHFFALAARIIMRVLGDYRDARNALKRGGGREKLSLDAVYTEATSTVSCEEDEATFERALHAIETLHAESPRQAEIASLRLYCELSVQRIATILEVSEATVNREWKLAKKRLSELWGETMP